MGLNCWTSIVIIQRIAETDFVRSAIADKADLSAFKKKPTIRVLLGVSAIGLSYVIGWPAITAQGVFPFMWTTRC